MVTDTSCRYPLPARRNRTVATGSPGLRARLLSAIPSAALSPLAYRRLRHPFGIHLPRTFRHCLTHARQPQTRRRFNVISPWKHQTSLNCQCPFFNYSRWLFYAQMFLYFPNPQVVFEAQEKCNQSTQKRSVL